MKVMKLLSIIMVVCALFIGCQQPGPSESTQSSAPAPMEAAPDAGTMQDMSAAHSTAATAPGAVKVEAGAIAKADGGQTIDEVVHGAADFGGKEVKIRGKVTKFNSGIMGSNWIHLSDGSGHEGHGDDLTVTTQSTVNVGDTVVISGKLSVNKDFGMGYKYDVIVEDAQVTVE